MSYGRCVAIVRHWQILTTIFAKNSPPVRRSEFFPIRHQPAPVTTPDATFRPAVRCSGHIDRGVEMMGRWNLRLRSIGQPRRDDFRLCLSLSEFDSVHKHGGRCSGALAISVHQHAPHLRNTLLRTGKDSRRRRVSVIEWLWEAMGETDS